MRHRNDVVVRRLEDRLASLALALRGLYLNPPGRFVHGFAREQHRGNRAPDGRGDGIDERLGLDAEGHRHPDDARRVDERAADERPLRVRVKGWVRLHRMPN